MSKKPKTVVSRIAGVLPAAPGSWYVATDEDPVSAHPVIGWVLPVLSVPDSDDEEERDEKLTNEGYSGAADPLVLTEENGHAVVLHLTEVYVVLASTKEEAIKKAAALPGHGPEWPAGATARPIKPRS